METIETQLQSAGLSWRIWRNGETFNKGELATHKGSLWIAQQDAATSRPGTDAQWKLAVKSGSVPADANTAPAVDVRSQVKKVVREQQAVAIVRALERRGDRLTPYARALLTFDGDIDAAVQSLSPAELEESR